MPVPTYSLLRDTLYILDSIYLEVRIDQQMIYIHCQNGTVEKDPMFNRKPGSLKMALQHAREFSPFNGKSQRYMSRRFETWLNYWMPFDGGIGFHGLDGRSYYKHLGRRPSSHGCVRISNETGRELYKRTFTGTIVYVHSGSPARLLKFATSVDTNLRVINEDDSELLTERLKAVQRCQEEHPSLTERLALRAGRKTIKKITVGRATRTMRIHYELTPLPDPLFTGPSPVAQSASPPISLLKRRLFEQALFSNTGQNQNK